MADCEDRSGPSTRPGIAIAEKGMVLLDGPRGAVVALTPEAAVRTGQNLHRAATLAAQQRREAPYSSVVPMTPAKDVDP